jgi:hypothetical protein
VPAGRGRSRLVADRLFSHLADRDFVDGPTAGWAVPEELARDLWHRLDPTRRARVVRVALARGEDQVALWLATQVSPDDLEPEDLYRLGVTLAERSAAHAPEPGRWDRGAVNWLLAALDRADDPDLVHRAQRMILLLEERLEARLRPPEPKPPEPPAPEPPAPEPPAPEPQAPDVPRARTPADDAPTRLIYLRPRDESRA